LHGAFGRIARRHHFENHFPFAKLGRLSDARLPGPFRPRL
jgi:hypothetical protein